MNLEELNKRIYNGEDDGVKEGCLDSIFIFIKSGIIILTILTPKIYLKPVPLKNIKEELIIKSKIRKGVIVWKLEI